MENKLALGIIGTVIALALLGALIGNPAAGLIGGPYLILYIAGAILLALLFWAPMKLYSIDKTLKKIEANQAKQTELLAAIAGRPKPLDLPR